MSGFTSGMRTSDSTEWTTPRDLFEELDREFHFTLDVASTNANALVANHYTKADDGLSKPWTGAVWCNPPYGREIGRWVERAATTNEGGGERLAHPRKDGHGLLARVGVRQGVEHQVHQGALEVRRRQRVSAVPERGCHLRQAPEKVLGGSRMLRHIDTLACIALALLGIAVVAVMVAALPWLAMGGPS